MRRSPSLTTKVCVLLGGVVAAVAISTITAGLVSTTAVTETALVLAVLVCVTSVVWWPGGAATSLAAGLALNWAHTEPRHSLRITSTGDIVIVALLTLLGPGVGLLVRSRERDGRRTALGEAAVHGTSGVTDAERGAVPALGLWHDTLDAVGSPLLDIDVRLVNRRDPAALDLPVIARGARLAGTPAPAPSVVLPPNGAVLHFADPRIDRVLVLSPHTGRATTEVDRATLFSFRDHVEATLLRSTAT